MERRYIVVYLSEGGMYYNFRCYARTKRDARKQCHGALGVRYADMTDVYIDEWEG